MSSEADLRFFAHYTISKDNSGFGEEDGDLTILIPGPNLASRAYVEEDNGADDSSSPIQSNRAANPTDNTGNSFGGPYPGQQPPDLGRASIDSEHFNLDFSALENADALENFDFDSFIRADDNFDSDSDRFSAKSQTESKPVSQSEDVLQTHALHFHYRPPSAPSVIPLPKLSVPMTKRQLQPARPSDMGPPPPRAALRRKRRKLAHTRDYPSSNGASSDHEDSFLNAMVDEESAVELLDKLPTILFPHEIPVEEQRPTQRSSAKFNDQASNGDVSTPANVPYGHKNEALYPSVAADLNGQANNTSQPLASSTRADATGEAVEVYPTQQPKQDFDERIDHLRAQIHALERKKKDRVPCRWRVIHRVPDFEAPKHSTSEGWIAYLDQPRWKRGIVGNFPLAGTEPIADMPSYLERHSELVFVVYREYGPEDPVGSHVSTVGEPDRRSLEEGYPAPTAERLRLVSRDLIKAMHEFSKSLPSCHGIEWGYPFDEGYLIAAPYLLMYFHQEAFSQTTAKLPKPAQHQWEMLQSYVYKAFGAEYDEARKHFQQGLVSPRFVKYLFRPGDILRVDGGSSTDAVQALGIVKQLTKATAQNKRSKDASRDYGDPDDDDYREVKDYKSFYWSIGAQYYNFHSWFDLADRTFTIDLPTSHEPVPITHLDLYPMEYATPQLQKTLEDRGKSFWKCRHRRFVEYSKGGSLPAWSGIKSRYMIDPVTYIKMHGRQDVGPRGAAEDAAEGDIIDQQECPDYPFPMLLPRTIKGYNFIEKAWLEIDVEFVSDVKWNFKAFQNLVLDEETKDILEALVTHQLATEASTDLIEGKGNGLIILLHGGPGTGKTYTAESVADYAQKPLYRVTCGDIGTEPVDVEKYLETVLRLGRIWNCVILLDEADVFLEERSLNDLQRNALVSVFLRVLEYYNGILILTTNRVGHFDEAFRSRIQLALHYKSLDVDQRKQIWTNFIKNLKASGTCEIDFDDLVMHVRDLSEFEMNGRQIRNVITTTRQLAEFRKKSLNFEILKKVILITGRFDKYLQDVKRVEQVKNGTVDDEIARDLGNR